MSTTGLYQHDFNDDGLKKFALNSLLAHTAFIVLGVLMTQNLGMFSSSLENENLQLIEASVRVDVVAMPKMTVKELRALEAQAASSSAAPAKPQKEVKAEPQVEKVADDSKAPVLKQEQKKKSVSDIFKQAASQRSESVSSENSGDSTGDSSLSEEARKRLRALVAAGNKVSEGTSLSGSGNSLQEVTAFTTYISQLPELVRPNWRLPSYLIDQELRARVRIYISSRGDLIKAEIYESSGNDEYDERALQAVRNSSPFPPMEEEIVSRGIRGDILLGFPL